jgi:tripartite ATP-independent transporter DctP family solute receptor
MRTPSPPTLLVRGLALAFALVALPPVAEAQIQDRNLKFGYGIAEDHPLGQGANRFAQIVSQKSGGKLKVRPYPANALGTETAMISSAQGGVQEMVGTSSAAIVSVQKEYAIFDLPFLFSNEKEAYAVLDGPVGKSLLDKLDSKGLVGLCYWETGFRHVTSSKRPITKSDDLKGLKIRTMQNPVYIEAFNTLGANAVPMAFTELYTALETKAIDAQENPYGIIHANKINEVQKYLSATYHAYSPFVVMVSKKLWTTMSPEEKKILQDACGEARDYQRKLSAEMNAKIVAELKQKGMVFNEVSPAEVAKMRESLQPVTDKYSKSVGEDLVKQTQAEIDKVRKQK